MSEDKWREVFREWEARDREYYRGNERAILFFYGGGALLMLLLGVVFVFGPML